MECEHKDMYHGKIQSVFCTDGNTVELDSGLALPISIKVCRECFTLVLTPLNDESLG